MANNISRTNPPLLSMLSYQVSSKALELERKGLSLFNRTIDEHVSRLVNAHPLAKDLHETINSARYEALALDEGGNTHEPAWSIQRFAIEPIADRFLNRIYRDARIGTSSKITLIIQDLGGFGDLIFGARELEILQKEFPTTQIRMLTNGASKLKTVLGSIECPIIEYKNHGNDLSNALLRDSDLIIVSPTGTNTSLLPEEAKKRSITILEYNRPDYGLNVRKGHLMTGIGSNTLGIFIDEKMRSFAESNLSPIKPEVKAQLLGELENKNLYDLIKALGETNRCYLGYGHNDMDRFLEVLTRYEARLDERDAIVLAISTSCYEKSLQKRLKEGLPPGVQRIVMHSFAREMTILRSLQKQEIALDLEEMNCIKNKLTKDLSESNISWVSKHYENELAELNKIIENEKSNPSPKPKSEFKQSLVNGLFFTEHGAIESALIAESEIPGKTLHIVEIRESLSSHDTHLIKMASEEICLSTGDQSLTEDISLGKSLMYDLRKPQPIEALWTLAKQHQCYLASEFFRSFAEDKPEVVVECLLKKSQLREELQNIYSIIYEKMDFAPELISLVKRKLSKGQEDRENQIHNLVQTHIHSNRNHELLSILRLVDEIQQAHNKVID